MIIDAPDLATVRRVHAGETIAYTNGCFDVVHEGHLQLVQKCADVADIVVIGITPDERVRQRKGACRPILGEATRLAVVSALKGVDYSLITPLADPVYAVSGFGVLESLRPDYFITEDPAWHRDEAWLNDHQIELIKHAKSDTISTTSLVHGFLQAALHSAKINN